jgi:uncharacterized membrane protein
MSKIISLFIIVISLGIGLVSAHGESEVNYDGHHGMMSGFYGMYGMGVFGWIFMLLVFIALVLFIVWLVRQLQEGGRK